MPHNTVLVPGEHIHENPDSESRRKRNLKDMDKLRIDPQRFQADFDELASIGATPDQGVHRPALSKEHLAVVAI